MYVFMYVGMLIPYLTRRAQRVASRVQNDYSRCPKVGNPTSPQSLRVMYRESQHYLALILFPTLWTLLYGKIEPGPPD